MKRNLFASTVGVLAGRLTLPFFSFLLFFVTARKLTIGDFGVYVLLTGLITLFQGIATLGLGQLLSREVGKQPEEEGVAVVSAVAIVIPASVAACGLFLALSYMLKGGGEFFSLAIIISLSLPLSSLIAISESVFMARGAGTNLFYLGLIEQGVRVALSILALLQGYGLYGLTAAYVASRLIAVIAAAYLYARVDSRPPLRWDGTHLRHMCAQLKSFAPIMILGLLLYRSDVLTLGWFLSDEQMGLYGCAIRIVNFSFILPDSVVAAAFPHVSRRWLLKDPAFGKDMRASLEFLLATGLAGVVAMAACAPFTVPIVFGAKFAGAVPLLAVLAFMLPSHSLEIQASNLLQAIGQEKTALYLMLLSLPAFFGFISLGAALGGLGGAAFGFVAASWLMGIIAVKTVPSAALPLDRGSPLPWAIILTVALLLPTLVWQPESDLAGCLLLAAVALTSLIGSGIVKSFGFARIKAVLS